VKNIHLIILTGISGSGKSTALRALEDSGYFCVDNLPAALVMPFAEEILRKYEGGAGEGDLKSVPKYALLVDCRDEAPFSSIAQARKLLSEASLNLALVFIDCTDEVAARRFRETRRKHPLLNTKSESRSIIEALEKERALLKEFRSEATKVIDTSRMNVHELKKSMEDFCEERRTMLITLQSFGYKYGNPTDVDLLFDVRFLPNPYFEEKLKEQTGLSLQVRDFVIRNPDTIGFLDQIESMLEFLLPKYEIEGKQYLSIGIGCTGGKHRSVVVTEELLNRLRKKTHSVQIFHRDIEK
jgi:UPF0042 nucleotide-binding protein